MEQPINIARVGEQDIAVICIKVLGVHALDGSAKVSWKFGTCVESVAEWMKRSPHVHAPITTIFSGSFLSTLSVFLIPNSLVIFWTL
jgi:hypothetical protein